MKRDEMQQIRDALQHFSVWGLRDEALRILDAALAAPEPQRPVGMVTVYPKGGAASCLVEMSDTLPPEGLYSLYTAPVAAPEPQQPVAWTSVKDAMPKSGVTVLACYRNSLGNIRRIRAKWTAAKTVESNSEFEWGDYDEATDAYWTPEGWYECIDNWDEYSSVMVCEGEVTHWMPLPLAPDEEILDAALRAKNEVNHE